MSEPEEVSLRDLVNDPQNANLGTERGRKVLRHSLEKLGAGRSILLDRHNRIIAGNKATEQALAAGLTTALLVETDGSQLVAVRRNDLDLDEPKAREMATADNRAGELDLAWNAEAIAAQLDGGLDLSAYFSGDELEDLLAGLQEPTAPAEPGEGSRAEANRTLAERFGVPPFSVLDARQGYWQDRKRAWLALGIESELGRGGNTLGESEGVNERHDNGQGPYSRANASPGGSPRPAASLGKDGKTVRGDGRGKPLALTFGSGDPGELAAKYAGGGETASLKTGLTHGTTIPPYDGQASPETQSGTSIFDPVLCELVYRWFCPEGGAVLDLFAGGSVRGIVAEKLGRSYTGIELRAEQVEANGPQATRLGLSPRWLAGDSRQVRELAPGEYDLIFSCPPYADLERYSDDPADLSTLAYPEFLKAYRAIIAGAVSLLKPDRFACFVVGDVRDAKGFYLNFVSDTIAAFEDAGAKLYNEAILVTAVGSLPIRVGRQFEAGRKLGKTHQNVVVCYKGEPGRIKEWAGACEFGALAEDGAGV